MTIDSLFDGVLTVSPGFGEAELAAVPAKRGVLALTAEGDQPILLLTAADLRARLRTRLREPLEGERRKSADLREITRKILWKLSRGHFQTDLNYLELARAIWPRTYTELLAAKPPWVVRVRPREKFPHFVRERLAAPAGTDEVVLGPFESGTSADKFIQSLQDAFDLCRDHHCLRQAPGGPPCAYLQMGRCLGPCNGTISLEQYRDVVSQAAAFAAGDRAPRAQALADQMKQAAAQQKFEQAATLKARVERLREFDSPAYRFVAPLDQFQFLILQPGATRKKIDVFVVNGPLVAQAESLDYPPKLAKLGTHPSFLFPQAAEPFDAKKKLGCVPSFAEGEEAGFWRMGLVTHYLFSGPSRAGLILRWRANLSPAELAAAIESHADALHVSAKPTAGSSGTDGSADAPVIQPPPDNR